MLLQADKQKNGVWLSFSRGPHALWASPPGVRARLCTNTWMYQSHRRCAPARPGVGTAPSSPAPRPALPTSLHRHLCLGAAVPLDYGPKAGLRRERRVLLAACCGHRPGIALRLGRAHCRRCRRLPDRWPPSRPAPPVPLLGDQALPLPLCRLQFLLGLLLQLLFRPDLVLLACGRGASNTGQPAHSSCGRRRGMGVEIRPGFAWIFAFPCFDFGSGASHCAAVRRPAGQARAHHGLPTHIPAGRGAAQAGAKAALALHARSCSTPTRGVAAAPAMPAVAAAVAPAAAAGSGPAKQRFQLSIRLQVEQLAPLPLALAKGGSGGDLRSNVPPRQQLLPKGDGGELCRGIWELSALPCCCCRRVTPARGRAV